MPKKKKSSIKVTEIPSKIKEVSSTSKESKLEEEVSPETEEQAQGFSSSQGRVITPIINRDESAQSSSEPEKPREDAKSDSGFAQTRAYSARPIVVGDTEQLKSGYVSREESMRLITPSIRESSDFSSRRRVELADSMAGRPGVERKERGYSEPIEVEKKEAKRKYPWEN